MTTPSFYGYGLSPKLVLASTWEVVADFVALVNVTGITLNISPPFTGDDNSMLVLELEIISKSNTGNQIVLQVNGISASQYDLDGRTIKGGVETILNLGSQTGFNVANLTIFSGGSIDDVMHCLAYFQLNKSGVFQQVGCQSFTNSVNLNANQYMSGGLRTSQTEINEIKIVNFSASMGAGSRATLYKVSR